MGSGKSAEIWRERGFAGGAAAARARNKRAELKQRFRRII
jgi:hypothetical protein